MTSTATQTDPPEGSKGAGEGYDMIHTAEGAGSTAGRAAAAG